MPITLPWMTLPVAEVPETLTPAPSLSEMTFPATLPTPAVPPGMPIWLSGASSMKIPSSPLPGSPWPKMYEPLMSVPI